MRYSTVPKQRKYVKDTAFCHLQENLTINMVKNQWILQQNQELMLQILLLNE